MQNDDEESAFDDLSNREILRIMLEEMACVSRELKEDFKVEITALGKDVQDVTKRFTTLEKDLKNFTFKVDRNQLTFMHIIDTYDGRLTAVEAKV